MEKSECDAVSKVFLANEKVALSLAREEKTTLVSQMKMDKLVVESKSKQRDTGKRGAKFWVGQMRCRRRS